MDETELALAVSFPLVDEEIDSFLDMLQSNGMLFVGGGGGRIIMGYEDEEEEVPPLLEILIMALADGTFPGESDRVFGYIRNKDQASMTDEQRDDISLWFDGRTGDFQAGNLVDIWKIPIGE